VGDGFRPVAGVVTNDGSAGLTCGGREGRGSVWCGGRGKADHEAIFSSGNSGGNHERAAQRAPTVKSGGGTRADEGQSSTGGRDLAGAPCLSVRFS